MRALPLILLLLASTASIFVFTVLANQSSESELTGVLTRDGEQFLIDGTELGLGPWRHVSTALAPANFDGDGAIETVELELDGLVGTEVTVQNLNPDRDQGFDLDGIWKRFRRGDFSLHSADGTFDVYVINGMEYRNPDEPPPWSNDPSSEGG